MVPEGVARPSSAEEVVEILREAASKGQSVTPAGAQTSTTGASITDRGVLLSLRGLGRTIDVDPKARIARVESGVLIGALKSAISPEGLLFAPDPTSEEESTIGGAIACNASGARTLRYGPTRAHVSGLVVALASGELLRLSRPRLEKNTVGYALAHDPVDWFIGSEGTLGVVVEAELMLLPMPGRITGLGIPFPSERDALAFVIAARDSAALDPRCLEWFDRLAFGIVRSTEAGSGWATSADSLVYLEDTGDEESAPPLDAWLELASAHHAIEDEIRVFDGSSSLRDARRMRHAVPAHMNERGASHRPAGGRKVSTDWAVPYQRLPEAIDVARRAADAAGIEQAVCYGHAGNGHPHQNFIARDAEELRRIEAVVEETLRFVLSVGGTVAAEHGIGKIKRKWLPLQATPIQLSAMRAIKHDLDPNGMLAPGNVF